MAKLTLDTIAKYDEISKINNNFDKIEAELQNKVLYRNNPVGEPNTIEGDVDFNNKNVFNVNEIRASDLLIDGVNITASVAASQTAAAASATAAASSASSASSSASAAATSASQAAAAADFIPEIANYVALRAYSGPITEFHLKGHTSVLDGGAGVFRVDSADTTSADNGGTILVDAAGRRWKREFSGAINVRWFGATPGGVSGADNASAIQAAFNAVVHGGSVYFPKAGGGAGTGPSYRIDSGVTLAKNDVTLFSDHLAEYSEGLITSNAIDMLTITGYGARIQGLSFTGNGSSTVFGTANGVVIDRSSLGDAETYSNLDTRIEDCMFFRLKDGVRGKGRNVFVMNNMFSECKRGIVGELHTYGAGVVSEFRGWRVSRNRFHSCGGQYIAADSSEALPANLAALDSWCIQMPQTSGSTSHLEVGDNNADFCGAGFYKGYLAGAKIAGNQTHGGTAIFVYAYITDAANQAQCSNFVNVIENNSINSRTADQTTDRGYLFSLNSIVVFGVSNLVLERNAMHNAAQSHILVTACTRASVRGNSCSNGNMLFIEDATTRPCIYIDQSANVTCTDNKAWSTIGTVYSEGIKATTCSGLKLRDNTILNAVTPVTASASDLVNATDEGLPWQTPAMLNAYVLGASSRGYRRLFNGMVEIDVQVTGGADNVAAFQLPAGYRPASPVVLTAVALWTDGSDAYATIETGGLVIINWNVGAAVSYHIRHVFEVA